MTTPADTMLHVIRRSWHWTGLDAAEVVAENDFGNVIVRAADGAYWRICPEDLSCRPIARDAGEYAGRCREPGFQRDWEMRALVDLARTLLGPATADRCYCLKLPAPLGGAYDASNLGMISRAELLSFAGDAAMQLQDVPDGSQVVLRLKTTERDG